MREPHLVVIASHNRSKSREIEQLLRAGLADLPVEIRLLADYPDAPPPPDENADSYVGNAVIKARACAAFTRAISFADDAGLEIDAVPRSLKPSASPTTQGWRSTRWAASRACIRVGSRASRRPSPSR